MRSRGFAAPGTLLISLLAGFLFGSVVMDWGWVSVNVKEEGHHIRFGMPLPISLAKIAVNFIPEEEINVDLPQELLDQREAIIETLEAIIDCPDCTLVKVNSPDAVVVISKKRNRLVWDINADDAIVTGSMPIKPFLKVLKRWDWETFDRRMIKKLLSASNGTEVFVHTEEAKIRVRI